MRVSGRVVLRDFREREATDKYDASFVISVVPLDGTPTFDLVLSTDEPLPSDVGLYDISFNMLRFGSKAGYFYAVGNTLEFKRVN